MRDGRMTAGVARQSRPGRKSSSLAFPLTPGSARHVCPQRCAHSHSGAGARSKGPRAFPCGCLVSPPSPMRRNAPPAHPLRECRGAPNVRARPSGSQPMHELERSPPELSSRVDEPVRRALHPVGCSRPRGVDRTRSCVGGPEHGPARGGAPESYISHEQCPNALLAGYSQVLSPATVPCTDLFLPKHFRIRVQSQVRCSE